MVWFRLGKYDNALEDLNATLAAAPGLAQSLFMRGIVWEKVGKIQDAEADIVAARAIDPSVERNYARFGVKP